MKRSCVHLALLAAAAILMTSSAARAQGYSVYEQSACTTGRGGAAVASPCQDGSAIYFNPAGLSFDSATIGLGASLIGPTGDFTGTKAPDLGTTVALNKKWYPVPNIYLSVPFANRVAFGVGVFAPYGLTTDWPENSAGRFLGYKSVVQGVYVQPTVALKLHDTFSVGAGVDIVYLNVELNQRADLATQTLSGPYTFEQLHLLCPVPGACGRVFPGTDFADIQLKGHAYSTGFHFGALAKPHERLSLGLRWMTGQRVDVDDATITTKQISVPNVSVPVPGVGLVPVNTLMQQRAFASGQRLFSGQKGASTIPLPDQVVAGIAVQAAAKIKFLVDYEYTRWSMFDVLPIQGEFLKETIVESYQDTHGVRIGTEINLSKGVLLRAGFDGHGAAAPPQTVTPNLPEAARQEYTVGLGFSVSPRVRFDVGYMYLHQEDRAGRIRSGGVDANTGTYKFRANIPTVMLAFNF